jgi:glutamate 5-kinase
MVIKLGTQVLNDHLGTLDVAFLASIARQVAALRQRGISVTLVSSGAIGAGLRELKQIKRPTDLARLQATAAVGQRKLMDQWADAFEPFKLPVAQLLLTREDIEDRARYLNLRNTIAAVHELGAVPIVNENDTVSTDELVKITFGDNDILAATVAHALSAHLLVLLSVVDGVLDAAGQAVRTVNDTEQARDLVRRERTILGKGGMDSKLTAARMVTDAGEVMIVADGRMEDVLLKIIDGQEVGTIFVPTRRRLSSRSRWIGSRRPAGAVVVDEGAVRALVEKHRSLLPAGIRSVLGQFERGDVIEVKATDGRRVAQGLCNYAAGDLARICGKKTAEVRAVLGEAAYDEAIHRDNLVVG